ncbi:MAG: thiamine pyrophosphate-dependent enzyme [Propionibacteriaceae bacterium]
MSLSDLDVHFRATLADQSDAVATRAEPRHELAGRREWVEELFLAQARSRHLDRKARELQATGEGFYTIGSAGHESNAVLGLLTRATDPALLHYRSGGFYCARAALVPGSSPVRDVLQGLMGLADEPIAGGRHKVFGRRDLDIIPQTSTIASHLPRAVGLAIALSRAVRLGVDSGRPSDAIVVCSFGDASANHSTAAGAINTALATAYRGLSVPILFVCEDNGYGISVPTPAGWIERAYGGRRGLSYLTADGADLDATVAASAAAVARARTDRRPVFLHLRTVRYGGHAGSDAEIGYRRPRELAADFARDPLLATATALVRAGLTAAEVLDRYDGVGADVDTQATLLRRGRRLSSAEEILAPLAPHHPHEVERVAATLVGESDDRPRSLAESMNRALAGVLAAEPRTLVFGEDVGVKGGVYGVTGGLARRFGGARVFDTILDEQSILGLALGAGLAGFVPLPEIQYLAYLHNAIDQLRGEAASLGFFSTGRYTNPLVLRVAGLAYQKGFGGHFHNDNGLASLRDIPGILVACPARGDDAAAVLRTCVAAAVVDGAVAVILEPIALYHQRDLHEPGDAGMLSVDHDRHVPVGSGQTYGTGTDLTMISFGNGVPMSRRVARRLDDLGVRARVLDLRWLAPLPVDDIGREARATGRVLVVDETRYSGGVGEGVVSALVQQGFGGRLRRVSSRDSFVPLGSAAQHVLLGEDDIEKAALDLVRGQDTTYARTDEGDRS